jgi:hypothetical protein
MKNMIAPCGIDCEVCDAYIATQNDDIELKKKLAEDYKKNFNKEIALADLDCDGCISNVRHIGFCEVCKIRACARDKGYVTCAECDSFPCETGSFIWTAESKSRAKLEELRNKR